MYGAPTFPTAHRMFSPFTPSMPIPQFVPQSAFGYCPPGNVSGNIPFGAWPQAITPNLPFPSAPPFAPQFAPQEFWRAQYGLMPFTPFQATPQLLGQGLLPNPYTLGMIGQQVMPFQAPFIPPAAYTPPYGLGMMGGLPMPFLGVPPITPQVPIARKFDEGFDGVVDQGFGGRLGDVWGTKFVNPVGTFEGSVLPIGASVPLTDPFQIRPQFAYPGTLVSQFANVPGVTPGVFGTPAVTPLPTPVMPLCPVAV